MGKKTKKQKMRALEHKIHALEHGQHVHIRVPEITRSTTTPTHSKVSAKHQNPVKATTVSAFGEDIKLRKYFIRDFKKSIVLVTMIIAVEVALYFIF